MGLVRGHGQRSDGNHMHGQVIKNGDPDKEIALYLILQVTRSLSFLLCANGDLPLQGCCEDYRRYLRTTSEIFGTTAKLSQWIRDWAGTVEHTQMASDFIFLPKRICITHL